MGIKRGLFPFSSDSLYWNLGSDKHLINTSIKQQTAGKLEFLLDWTDVSFEWFLWHRLDINSWDSSLIFPFCCCTGLELIPPTCCWLPGHCSFGSSCFTFSWRCCTGILRVGAFRFYPLQIELIKLIYNEFWLIILHLVCIQCKVHFSSLLAYLIFLFSSLPEYQLQLAVASISAAPFQWRVDPIWWSHGRSTPFACQHQISASNDLEIYFQLLLRYHLSP